MTLNLEAVDAAEESAYFMPAGRAPQHGEVPNTGSPAEMRVADHLSAFADPEAGWMPYEPALEGWFLSNCPDRNVCTVYAQFRDETGNVSYTSHDEIDLVGTPLFLPAVLTAE